MESSPRRLLPRARAVRALLAAVVVALAAVAAAGAVGVRSAAAPANSSPPTIGGTAAVGSTVTANQGTWTGSTPLSFQYQWRICDANGNACHDIAGATSQTYQLRANDAGNTLRVRVIASNSQGSSTATSAPSAHIAAGTAGPRNTALPTESGTATVGSTLTADPGKWSGNGPISFKYQWCVCDANGGACHDISGATGQTYKVAAADAGNTIRVAVSASDSSGSTEATSVPSAKIGAGSAAPAPAPAPSGCPKLAAGATAVAVNDVATPARLQIDQFVSNTRPITRGMTSFSVRFHVSDTCGQAVSGATVYATGVPYNQVSTPQEATTDGSGWVTLTFNRESGFPAARNQELMVLFVRARKSGESLLAGISTRRLISLRVNLHR
jgi:hypothetical protein